jgi:voltage-gated potassium channel
MRRTWRTARSPRTYQRVCGAGHEPQAVTLDEARLDRFDELNDWVLFPAAIAVIPVILIEQSHASESWKAAAGIANWIIWLLFAAEAAVMLALSPARGRWARGHKLELAVVILTPPVLPPGLQSLRVLRLLRLLRLAAAVKLSRRLFSVDGVKYAAILTGATILAGGYAFASLEHTTTGEGVWWALVTATTVGYGDISPHTESGRAVGAAVMIIGTGFIALLTAAAAQRFLVAEIRQDVAEAVEGVELTEADIGLQLQQIRDQLERRSAAIERRSGGP